jgi:hypothetical protein
MSGASDSWKRFILGFISPVFQLKEEPYILGRWKISSKADA